MSQIALEWEMPAEILAVGLETLTAHLKRGVFLYGEYLGQCFGRCSGNYQ